MKTIDRRTFLRDGAALSAALPFSAHLKGQPQRAAATTAVSTRPNIVLIMADDMGFSDLGCYGSEIETPNLDRIGNGGLRFTQFYNCPRCCPSRACLMTGLYPHQVGFGLMADNYGQWNFPAYRGDLSDRCVTIAEALHSGGYQTAMSGKWHLTPPLLESQHNWPLQRGFGSFFGTIGGAGSYFDPSTLADGNNHIRAGKDFYYTDAIADHAVKDIEALSQTGSPFFLYTAFTAPHWPLHAPAADIEHYRERYQAGWDEIRSQRHARMIQMGIVKKEWGINSRDGRVPPWPIATDKDWEVERMAVYAAQLHRLDAGVGRILDKLQERGVAENTLILFLADNGGNYEEIAVPAEAVPRVVLSMPQETLDGRMVHAGNTPSIMPGKADTYQSYGIPWGNVSNTPFRYYKHYAHEGGISTPLIAYWPKGIQKSGLTAQVGQEIDIMATCLDIAKVDYPKTFGGRDIIPLEGKSLLPVFEGRTREGHDAIFWEHEGNSAVRQGKWKLVSKFPDYWELYDMELDRTEMHNLADKHPDRVKEMAALYDGWAKRVGVHAWPLPGMNWSEPGTPAYLRR